MFILSLRWMGNLGHFGRNPFANTEIDLQSNKKNIQQAQQTLPPM